MHSLIRNLVLAGVLLAGCAKNSGAPAAASPDQKGACVLTCEGKKLLCKEDIRAADCNDAAKKAEIFEAIPKCPHTVDFVAGKCPALEKLN